MLCSPKSCKKTVMFGFVSCLESLWSHHGSPKVRLCRFMCSLGLDQRKWPLQVIWRALWCLMLGSSKSASKDDMAIGSSTKQPWSYSWALAAPFSSKSELWGWYGLRIPKLTNIKDHDFAESLIEDTSKSPSMFFSGNSKCNHPNWHVSRDSRLFF